MKKISSHENTGKWKKSVNSIACQRQNIVNYNQKHSFLPLIGF